MPKIIEHLQTRLMEETVRQIKENGYGAVTIRSIARGCGVGTGTVYNYYPSKDSLIASYLLEDWRTCIRSIASEAAGAGMPQPVLRRIFEELRGFQDRHSTIFQDEAAASGFAGSFSRYHALLRSQLAAPLRKFCSNDFTAEFAAEALLTWTMVGTSFEEICQLLEKLF